ncbi:hypothetical protein C8R45DRAFT_1042144 [Mycena sanguinolenta]|nr:hypothetical protein C8R45DRAFT_1042144 [Mycena sanguinolenta]
MGRPARCTVAGESASAEGRRRRSHPLLSLPASQHSSLLLSPIFVFAFGVVDAPDIHRDIQGGATDTIRKDEARTACVWRAKKMACVQEEAGTVYLRAAVPDARRRMGGREADYTRTVVLDLSPNVVDREMGGRRRRVGCRDERRGGGSSVNLEREDDAVGAAG